MALTNLDKPQGDAPAYNLNIGDGYHLVIGGSYLLIIQPASNAFNWVNLTRPNQGETWASVTSSWATEDETWLGISQLIDNTAKPVTSISNIAKP